MRRWRTTVPAVLLALTAAGCTGAETGTETGADRAAGPSPAADPTGVKERSAAPVPEPAAPATTAPSPETPVAAARGGRRAAPHPVSLPALFAARYDGRDLRLRRLLARTEAYTQRVVTYRSGDLTISGVLNLPTGPGPHPVLVLAHGYIEPSVYVTGQGLRREQDWLARAGYAVLHVDYRNHAGSDRDPRADRRLRLGYTADVVNAVRAVRRSGMRRLDGDRVGLLGRSMGGGVVLNTLVTRPGLVDAAVIYSPVSSRTADNFNRWIRTGDPALAAWIIDRYGAPERNRWFWRQVSPRTFFDRVSEPVLVQHGTADESTPYRWSLRTEAALRKAGADVRLVTYPGQPHAFTTAWPGSMRRTVRFFDRHLG